MTTPELAAILSLSAFMGWLMLWCFAVAKDSIHSPSLARVYEIWQRFFGDSEWSEDVLAVVLLFVILLPAAAIAYIVFTASFLLLP